MAGQLLRFPEFPFDPYPSQLGFMSSLYHVLDTGGIGLLESPTGTGKTISIIASALQWLEDHRRRQQAELEQAQQQAAAAAVVAAGGREEPDWLVQAAVSMIVKQSQSKQGTPHQANEMSVKGRQARARLKRLKGAGTKVQSLSGDGSKATSEASKSGSQPSHGAAADDMFLLADPDGEAQGLGEEPAWVSTGSSDDEGCQKQDKDSKQPYKTQVIFCSRTHSQLSQFVGELKRTGFGSRLSMVALASRKVLCINREVSALGASHLINQQCLDMQQKLPSGKKRVTAGQLSSCTYLQHQGELSQQWEDEVLSQPLDVEELVNMSKSLAVCPYYAGRSALQHADVVLAPYSCVLQPDARQALGLNLQGAVLVIDEAHNLVDALHSMHSVAVTGSQLAAAQSMLAVYIARVGCRLSARNAQHVQLLQRMLLGLAGALAAGQQQQNSEQSNTKGQAHAAGKTIGQANTMEKDGGAFNGGQSSSTANAFLAQHELDDVNLFQLLTWVQESKLLLKLAGYSMWHAEAANMTAGVSSATGRCTAVKSGSTVRSSAGSARGEQLGALHACVAFLSALTSANADGRVLPFLAHPNQQAGDGLSRHAAGAASKADAAAAGQPEQQPLQQQQAEQEVSSHSSGCLKYVSLNAATHFGKVISQCRAVVLASGTLSPVEGLLGQLFSGNGLQLLQQPRQLPLHHSAVHPAALDASIQDVPHSFTAPHSSTCKASQCRGGAEGSNYEERKGGDQYATVLGSLPAPAQPQWPPSTMPQLNASTGVHCPGATASAEEACKHSHSRQPVSGGVQQGVGSDTGTRPVLHYACGHVIPAEQLMVLVAGSGPTGLPLELRHASRTVPATMDELGRLLLNVCRATPGGVVVFVPSFAYLERLWQRWQATGLLTTLQLRKAVFQEPRSAAEVDGTLQAYAAAIQAAAATQQCSSHALSPGNRIIGSGHVTSGHSCQADLNANQLAAVKSSSKQSTQLAAASVTGAMLLAVVGGKLSEGINFADDLGRCVVVLGLPYANPTDPELVERKAYLDAQHALQQAVMGQEAHALQQGQLSATAGTCKRRQSGCGITGQQLYESMCMNAVNQCVGRVVRHAKDWACVLLVDARYVRAGVGVSAAHTSQGPASSKGSTAGTLTAAPLDELARKQAPLSRLPAWMLRSWQCGRQDFGYCYGKLIAFVKQRTVAENQHRAVNA